MDNKAIGSQDVGYLLEIKAEGVFLTVYPLADGQEVLDQMKIVSLLQENAVTDIDEELIGEVLEQRTGEQVAIGSVSLPKAEWHISSDKMTVIVSFVENSDSVLITPAYVQDMLAERGIVYGVIGENVRYLAAHPEEEVLLAHGLRPIDGDNAYIKKYIDFSRQNIPSEMEYDRVDYKNLNLFFIVKKGDLLAERIPQTKGTPGKNVFGQLVHPRAGRPLPLNPGKNTQVDGDKLYSLIDGQAIDGHNNISVVPTLKIDGDVDVSKGNIHFNGTIFISGSLREGFSVVTSGDIHISGTVNGVVEGNSIYVGGGILGAHGNGSVKAKLDVHSTFIENANVTAGRDVIVSNVILHSTVSAAHNVIVKERKGLIVGGKVQAGNLIDARTVGNTSNIVTLLKVGENPLLSKELRELERKISLESEQLEQIENNIHWLESSANVDNKKVLELKRTRFLIAGNLQRDEKQADELSEDIGQLASAKIMVDDIVYTGVKIVIPPFIYIVQSSVQHVCFQAGEENIVLGSY